MIEKTLHSVNLAACCTQLVTQAVDLASSGGVATVAGAALSALTLKPSGRAALEKDVLAALETHLATAVLHADVERQVILILDSYLPDKTDFASGDMKAGSVAAHMRRRVDTETIVAEYRDPAVLDAYEALLTATLDPLLAPKTQSDANQAELLHRTNQLMQMMQAQSAETLLHDAGITEQAISELAARISAKTDDLGQAWRDLENAIEIAVQVQVEGHRSTNHGEFFDTVLARVAELSGQGHYADANAQIDAALEQGEAAKARLLESGVNIAKLEGNVERAARLLIAQADHAAGGVAASETLRALQDMYYERGRDKGVTLDCEIAIALARHVLSRATTADERSRSLNDLGAALQTLGERESGTARLEEAVQAYRDALLERARERVPLDWAMTQNNLGSALSTLGERESGTARLDEAVLAFREALLEWTRERVPLEWATTQNNLGTALRSLGERESGTVRLDEAVQAYRNALLERTRERVPLDWATTQNNLGNALQSLGVRESGAARLEEAVQACRDALLEWTRERVPLLWATTQNNLGNALKALGERESGTARLDEAVLAYHQALLEWTRKRVPLNWASTQFNLSGVEIAFFDKTADAAHLDRALDHAQDAREVFSAGGASHYVAVVDGRIAEISASRA